MGLEAKGMGEAGGGMGNSKGGGEGDRGMLNSKRDGDEGAILGGEDKELESMADS
jgi:hypothetical protein